MCNPIAPISVKCATGTSGTSAGLARRRGAGSDRPHIWVISTGNCGPSHPLTLNREARWDTNPRNWVKTVPKRGVSEKTLDFIGASEGINSSSMWVMCVLSDESVSPRSFRNASTNGRTSFSSNSRELPVMRLSLADASKRHRTTVTSNLYEPAQPETENLRTHRKTIRQRNGCKYNAEHI
jgi:hypothetical protein